MRPGWSIGSILRFYSCLNLISGLRLPRNTRGFRQLGRIGPHFAFVSGLREHDDYGASKSVGVRVRKTQCSGALGIFLNVDSELGEFGRSGRNGGLISPHGRDVDSSETGEKGKERRINKSERVDWVVPSVANTNDVEYSAGVTRNKESTTVVGDPFDGGSPVLGHHDVDGKKLFLCAGGEEEEKKCGAGAAAFHNASDKKEADSLTGGILGEDQVVEEQRRTDSTHHQISADDGGSASSFSSCSFSVMKPIGKDVGSLGKKATDTSINSEILRNRAILMQAKVDDLQESVARIIQILHDRGVRESSGLKEDTWPDIILHDDRQNAALLALTATEKECDHILDLLLLVLKDDDVVSSGMSIAQKERLILFQTRIKKFKEEFEVYRTKVSQLGEWEVQTRWMRQDLSNARYTTNHTEQLMNHHL